MDRIRQTKIGILGGTFDPVHYGHLLVAQSAVEEFDLDQVVFLPTGKSPHKSVLQVTNPQKRCAMVQLAIQDNPKFVLSVLEARNPNINYTYRTLQQLKAACQDTRIYFIMGEDSLDDFPNWKNPEEICRLASILVAVRNEDGKRIDAKLALAAKRYGADMHMLHSPNFSVSSRELRERVRDGKSVRYMLPQKVEAFIRQHSLYMG